jgi:outer membrane protein assembly factor BamB
MDWTRTRANWTAAIALSAALAAFGSTAFAQLLPEPALSPSVYLDEAQSSERSHLERATQFLADKQWDEAVETLRRLMDNSGAKLMPVQLPAEEAGGGYARYVPLRQICQMRLAELRQSAPEALALYRSRVDPLARRWYEEAVAERDPALLERVVEQMFVSSFGDDGLFKLGEFALERGEYTRARECWERISPLLRSPAQPNPLLRTPTGRPLWLALRGVDLDGRWNELEPLLTQSSGRVTWLAYPDSDLNLADVRARLVLVSIMEGSTPRALIEMDVLRRLHANAEGQLAGRQGKYVDLLAELLEQSKQWLPPAHESGWRTFAGSETRDATVADRIDIGGAPIWQQELPRLSAGQERIGSGRQRITEDFDGLLSYYPLIVGDTVFWNDAAHIRAFDLHTGEEKSPVPDRPKEKLGSIHEFGGDEIKQPHVGVPRFTMTVHGDKLLARMGSPITAVKNDTTFPRPPGTIVGMDVNRHRLLFTIPPPNEGDREWAFDGSPLSDGANLYVAMRHSQLGSARSEVHVACYDMQTAGRDEKSPERGRRWRTWICGADTLSQGTLDELTHNLLTTSEGTIYCNTNLGAVAALSARDGTIKWITRYPRAPFRSPDPERDDLHFFRDLNPCLVHKDLVIVAPTDCDKIFALDAATGQWIWESGVTGVVHLLGVGEDRLLASGDYLYWLDVHTGQLAGQFPPPGQNVRGYVRANPPGYGRGVLAGDVVYWPTREYIHVFRQQTVRTETGWMPVKVGQIELTQRGAGGGNLLIADGVLLIATADRLFAFNEFGRIRASPEAAQAALPAAGNTISPSPTP